MKKRGGVGGQKNRKKKRVVARGARRALVTARCVSPIFGSKAAGEVHLPHRFRQAEREAGNASETQAMKGGKMGAWENSSDREGHHAPHNGGVGSKREKRSCVEGHGRKREKLDKNKKQNRSKSRERESQKEWWRPFAGEGTHWKLAFHAGTRHHRKAEGAGEAKSRWRNREHKGSPERQNASPPRRLKRRRTAAAVVPLSGSSAAGSRESGVAVQTAETRLQSVGERHSLFLRTKTVGRKSPCCLVSRVQTRRAYLGRLASPGKIRGDAKENALRMT